MNDEEKSELLQLIEQGEVQELFKRLIERHEKIIENPNYYTSEEKLTFYRTAGEISFDFSQYEHAIGMFRQAQRILFSEEVDQLIQQTFILPNMNEFQKNYQKNLSLIGQTEHFKTFDELIYFLIPTETKNRYYLYHKKNRMIEDCFTLFTPSAFSSRTQNESDPASSSVWIDRYEVGNILSELSLQEEKEKTYYAILEEFDKFLGTLQGGICEAMSRLRFFPSLFSFKSFFETHSDYLPRNVISYCGNTEKAEAYLGHLHLRRLRSENKSREKVILSICVPSYNRGHRALENVINTLKAAYDYEIEIIVSNNGTKNDTASAYEEIKNYPDSRITYFEFDENQGFYANLVNVARLASGKFFMLLSDEDLIDRKALRETLAFLMSNTEVALFKPSSTSQVKFKDQMGSGKEAVVAYMLTSNYISGLTINTGLFREHKVFERIHEFYKAGNTAAIIYPHMCWELLMCQYGKVRTTSMILVHEGEAETLEGTYVALRQDKPSIPAYATIESRLEQHNAFFELLLSVEMANEKEMLREMYLSLCNKTFWLMKVSIEHFYRNLSSVDDLKDIIKRTYAYCTDERYLRYIDEPNHVIRGIQDIHTYYLQVLAK